MVPLAIHEEVDQRRALRLAREVEVEAAVEPAGTQQGGVQRIAAVRGRDEQDVVVSGLAGLELPVRRKVAVEVGQQLRADAVAKRRLIERLHLDQQLVHHAAAARGHHRRDAPAEDSARGRRGLTGGRHGRDAVA